MNILFLLLVFLIIILIICFKNHYFSKIFGGTNDFTKREIINLLQEERDLYKKNVIDHLNSHFNNDFSDLEEAVDFITKKFNIKSIEDFIRISALCQYNFLDSKKSFLLLQAPHLLKKEGIKMIKRSLIRLMNKCAPINLDTEDSAEFLATSHRFFKFTNKALKLPLTKLKKLLNSSNSKLEELFEVDEIPYKPFVLDFCKLVKKEDFYDLKKFLNDLYLIDPKLYHYAELSKIFNLRDLSDYLRRKILGYDFPKKEKEKELEKELQKEKELKLKLKEDLDLEKALRITEKEQREKENKDFEKDLEKAIIESLKEVPEELEQIPEAPQEEILEEIEQNLDQIDKGKEELEELELEEKKEEN